MNALAKKSTANQQCDFLLMVNSNRGRITYGLRDIFMRRGWKSPFLPTVFWLSTPIGTPGNINVIYASLKSTFSGLQFCHWQYRSIFICLAAVASQICEITRNSEKIRTYSSSRSSKVINIGANRKRICNFLLVITMDVPCTIFEILTHKARRALTCEQPHCPLTSSF